MKRADHHLVQQVLDGEVTPEQFDGFQQRLREEPELIDLYKGYALLQHTLSEEFEDGLPGRAAAEAGSRRTLGAGLVLLACALAALAALVWIKPWNLLAGSGNVAVATFSVDAVWQIDGPSENLGSATGLPVGSTLKLTQGRASVSLEPTVTVVLDGPSAMTAQSKNEIGLDYGRGLFRIGVSHGGLTVRTPKLTAVDAGTEFGMDSSPARADEVHVLTGKVNVTASKGGRSLDIEAGNALQVGGDGGIGKIQSAGQRFAGQLGRFETVVGGPFVRDDWRIDFGNPTITPNRLEGLNFTAYRKLARPEPADGKTVLLVTLEIAAPSTGSFHTDGWAGMSFFSGGSELLFFGDSFGIKGTWSLDVKQRLPVVLPEQPVTGPRTVTLRYDAATGDVTLHDGKVPLRAPICSAKMPPGLAFDEIRLGASAGAALAVSSLQIRVGGD